MLESFELQTCLHKLFDSLLLLERRRSALLIENNKSILQCLYAETGVVVISLAILEGGWGGEGDGWGMKKGKK